MKDFDACSLCLLRARDPRICAEGHVYCQVRAPVPLALALQARVLTPSPPVIQECILTNLLSQKKDIKRQSLLLERMRADSEAEMAASRAAARDRVLHEFESAQSSLGNKTTDGKVSATGADAEKAGMARGTKRSFQLDEDEIERLTNEATEEALRRTTQEMAEARKAKLPNYWLVSAALPSQSRVPGSGPNVALLSRP